MNFSPEIREFLEHGGRCLIIENGEPKFVISSFQEYLEFLRGKRNVAEVSARESTVAEINRDIEALVRSGEPSVHPGHQKHVFYAE